MTFNFSQGWNLTNGPIEEFYGKAFWVQQIYDQFGNVEDFFMFAFHERLLDSGFRENDCKRDKIYR